MTYQLREKSGYEKSYLLYYAKHSLGNLFQSQNT